MEINKTIKQTETSHFPQNIIKETFCRLCKIRVPTDDIYCYPCFIMNKQCKKCYSHDRNIKKNICPHCDKIIPITKNNVACNPIPTIKSFLKNQEKKSADKIHKPIPKMESFANNQNCQTIPESKLMWIKYTICCEATLCLLEYLRRVKFVDDDTINSMIELCSIMYEITITENLLDAFFNSKEWIKFYERPNSKVIRPDKDSRLAANFYIVEWSYKYKVIQYGTYLKLLTAIETLHCVILTETTQNSIRSSDAWGNCIRYLSGTNYSFSVW